MFSSHIPVIKLPVLLLQLPFAAALLIFCLMSVKFIFRFKAGGGRAFELGKRPVKIIFLIAITLETVLSIYAWYRFQSIKATSYMLSNDSWIVTLTGLGGLAARSKVQMDVFSATIAAVTSLIAFVACLRSMADKENELTPGRTVFFLLTLCGVMGVYFSGGLFNLFLSAVISQIGASGLMHPVLDERAEFGRTIAYFISRFVLLAILLAGCIILGLRYDIFSFAAISVAMRSGSAEKIAFALLAAPLLYLFIKPPHYTIDAAGRCYFAIRAQTAFFAFFKIVFIIYGAVAGLERIPALIGLIGLVTVFVAVMFASGEQEPIKLAAALESVLKGFIMITLAMSLNSVYSTAAITNYGYGALEAMLSLFLLFLPVSAAFSISAAHLRQEAGESKLWLTSGNSRLLPFTGLLFAMAVCILGGLPPFVGYFGRQSLYRSANSVSPFLTLILIVVSLLVLLIGLRYISIILFGKRNGNAERFRGDSTIILPLIVLFFMLVTGTILPGYFHNKIVSPSANFLINGVRHVADERLLHEQAASVAEEASEAESEEASEDDGGENEGTNEKNGQPQGSGESS